MDYVGSQVCATCHREIADQFSSHPMGHSSGSLTTVQSIEAYGDEAGFESRDGMHYQVEKDDQGIVHHEQLIDQQGEILYDQGVQMELSIGSGRRGRSYAYRRGNRFFMSPISWYTSKEKWDLSPGYQPGAHQRFDRLITERCLACHVGQMNLEPAPDTWNREVPIVEHGVSCERCHGPGSSHVKHHQHPETASEMDRIINPSHLDPARRDAVCNQCHFQSARTFPRYGRKASDFRPGDRLSDIYVVLPSPPGERKSVSHSEQMLSSKCYQESAGRLGCVSCHNPHSLPVGEVSVAYDQKCAACHSPDRSPCSESLAERIGKSCVGCHMPRFDVTNIPHTALTDHRILKRPEQKQAQEQEDQIFDEGGTPLPEWELWRALALNLRTDRKQGRKRQDLERAALILLKMTEQVADDPEIWEGLAWFGSQFGKWTEVEKYARKALELSPDRVDARELLVGALTARAAWADVDRECKLLLRNDPGNGLYYKWLADSAWFQGELEPGLEFAEKSLEFDPPQLELRRKLSVAYEQLGNSRRAELHRRIANELSRHRK